MANISSINGNPIVLDSAEYALRASALLPSYKLISYDLLANGFADYSSGRWYAASTRVGTPDIQHADKDFSFVMVEHEPELAYQLCYYDDSDGFIGWSQWKHAGDVVEVAQGTNYRVTIAYSTDSSIAANIADFASTLLVDTGVDEMAEAQERLVEKEIDAVDGFRVTPQLVRGYRAEAGGRPRPNSDQMRRMVCTHDPIFLYKGSYIYCDTANLYRCTITKYADIDGNMVTSHVNNVIPLRGSAITIDHDGYYGLTFSRYNNGALDIADMYQHVTIGLYTNRRNPMQAVFASGGKQNFAAPGDATFFIGETGTTVLVDGALENTQGQLLNCTRDHGISNPDYIIISHMHNDHIGGLVRLLANEIWTLDGITMFLPEQEGIDFAIQNNFLGEQSIVMYNQLMEYINAAENLTIIRPHTEWETYVIDGMTIKFWNVDHQKYIDLDDRNYNDYSLCCNIEYGNQRVCMSGDLGPVGMRENYGKNYKCNIYKCQHHGWDNVTDAETVLSIRRWVSTVFPEIVITEDGTSHDEILQRASSPMPDICEENGIPFYRTNQNGFISVRVNPDSYEITSPVIRWTKGENQ